MKPAKALTIGLVGAGVLATVTAVSAWGSAGSATTWPAAAQPTHVTPRSATVQPLTTGRLTITIYPRGATLEHVVPANFAVQPGVPLTLTFVNHTTRPHTFTSSGLGVSFWIRPGAKSGTVKTVVTFTPGKFGVFGWRCALPCGNDMHGDVYAIIGK